MESTAINTVYVVISLNLETDAKSILKVFGNLQDARNYKQEMYNINSAWEHIYYILEKIVY